MKTDIIFGPPGTGKTTHLLKLVTEELERGVPPDRIAYVSFTRKAANEAKERAIQTGLVADQLPWFRTLHSMAYAMLGMNKSSMMTLEHYKQVYLEMRLGIVEVRKMLGGGFISDDNPLASVGGLCDSVYSYARQTQTSLDQAWHKLCPNLIGRISAKQVKQYVQTLNNYKYENVLFDFTDLLERFVKERYECPVEVAFIDEAQDMTPLQWEMAQLAFRNVKRLYVAGDDDQAIYAWAGASVNKLLTMEGDRTVLGKSYRLPRLIHERACGIVGNIRERVHKDWTHNGTEGYVGGFSMTRPEDMSEGTWLLLARDGFKLNEYAEICRRQGLIYSRNGHPSIQQKHYDGIIAWEKLRKGLTVTQSDALIIYGLMGANVGFKWGMKKALDPSSDEPVSIKDLTERFGLLTTAPWYEALSSINKGSLDYYRRVLTRGEKLTATPRITISTIHGAKGGEADNVVLIRDVSATSHKQAMKNPCDEHRVFYVGATRAKKSLLLVQPETLYHYRM